jgi:hypothetical protein
MSEKLYTHCTESSLIGTQLSLLGSRQELHDSPQALHGFSDTSQISVHKNNKINLPFLQEMLVMMSLHTHTHTVPFKQVETHSFVALAADDLEMPVSCATRLSDLCGVCSNLTHIRLIFLR